MDENRKSEMSRGGIAGKHPDGPSADHPIPGIGENRKGGTHDAPTAEAVVDHPGGRDIGVGAAGIEGIAGREKTRRPSKGDPADSVGVGRGRE